MINLLIAIAFAAVLFIAIVFIGIRLKKEIDREIDKVTGRGSDDQTNLS